MAALLPAVGIVQGLGLAVLGLSVVLPSPAPETPDPLAVLIYDPPPAAALPLPNGTKLTANVVRRTTPHPVIEVPDPAELTVPMPATPVEPTEVEAEPPSPDQQSGFETGSVHGDPLGMEGGDENGIIGGLPGGTPGGLPGGTGMSLSPVADYDAPPRIIRQTRPRYPQDAFVQKIEGTVVVEIVIDRSGRVSQARVIRSVPLLDAAAIDAVREWVFEPAVRRGLPVPAIGHAPVRFLVY
jgi:protein TonB